MSARYFGEWSDHAGMVRDWSSYDYSERYAPRVPEGMPTDAEVLLAAYDHEGYTGSAFVIFERDGKVYENEGSHCSCHGLEDQWSPTEVTWPALALRVPLILKALESNDYGPLYSYGPEVRRAFVSLVKSRTEARQ